MPSGIPFFCARSTGLGGLAFMLHAFARAAMSRSAFFLDLPARVWHHQRTYRRYGRRDCRAKSFQRLRPDAFLTLSVTYSLNLNV